MNRTSFSISKSSKTSSTSSQTSRSQLKKLERSQSKTENQSKTDTEILESRAERMALIKQGRKNAELVSRAQHNRQGKSSQFDACYGDSF